MSLSDTQLAAIKQATSILNAAGILLSDLARYALPPPVTALTSSQTSGVSSDTAESCNPSPAVMSSLYEPPRARIFTQDESKRRTAGSRLNRQTLVDGIIDHPLGAIVEYPETGLEAGQRIAHRFVVDPVNFVHPRSNFQYSLGDEHGGHKNVHCYLLVNEKNPAQKLLCSHIQTSCQYFKNRFTAMHFYSHLSLSRQRLEDMLILPAFGCGRP